MKKQNNEGTNTGLPKRYFKLKNKLQFWMKYDKQICELWLVGISLIIYTIAYTLLKSCNLPSTISCLAALALVLPFTMQGFMLASMFVDARKLSLESKLLEYESEMLQKEVADDIFENSIKMSYKYLDQYYLQTRKHSQNGFFITVCVAVFGALLIFAGVIAMFLGEVKPSYVTCASGAITELIAAVFFYLYNKIMGEFRLSL